MESPTSNQESRLIPNDPETVNSYASQAADWMKTIFGIENLSVNERVIIRKITEESISNYNNSLGTVSGEFSMPKEIMVRFLREAYGIDFNYLESIRNYKLEEFEDVAEFIRRTRERAHLI